MRSIFNDDFKITSKALKEEGFERTPWGSPKAVIYPKKRCTSRKAKLVFDKCQYCWMLYDNYTDNYWRGLIYYYPDKFEGYVTAFQGMENWTKKNPEHPAGYAYITVDNRDDHWYNIIKIDSMEDIIYAKAQLIKRIKKLNKDVFGL